MVEKRSDIATCSQDLITVITKIIYDMKDYGCFIGEKRFKQDLLKNKKDLEQKKANYFDQKD